MDMEQELQEEENILTLTDENGEDVYVSIDDEKLMETLFEKYLAMVESEDGEDE